MRTNTGSLARANFIWNGKRFGQQVGGGASPLIVCRLPSWRVFAGIFLGFIVAASSSFAQIAQVQHAPSVSGRVEGTVQQMTGEAVTFNSGAVVTGDLLVPGTPTIV